MTRIVAAAYNTINSNLLKKYYPISKKQRGSNNNCLNNAKPRNKINIGAWNEISSWNLVQINFKAAKKYYIQLFYSLRPWQMHLTSTNGAKQHHLYVCIVTRIKHLVMWLLAVKHRWEKSLIIIVIILYYWT